MDEKQYAEFSSIAKQCGSGQFRTINVASQVRSGAILAAWDDLLEARDVLIKMLELWDNYEMTAALPISLTERARRLIGVNDEQIN